MRFIWVFCFLAFQIVVNCQLTGQLHAQATEQVSDTNQLPRSLDRMPQDIAFCYGIHNGADFVNMLVNSKFVSQLNRNGEIAGAKEAVVQSLSSGELQLGVVEIDFDDAAEKTIDALKEHEQELRSLALQLLATDAILIGDESWSTTWEALSQCVLIAKQNVSLVPGDQGSYKLIGTDAMLSDKSFAKIRIPNTVLSFQLTDTAPAKHLLGQLSQSAADATPDDLEGWQYRQTAIAESTLSVFSYPLDQWLLSISNEEEMDAEGLAEREVLLDIFRGRSLQLAFGLVDSRFVVFVGEDWQCIAELLGEQEDQTLRLKKQKELASVFSLSDETLIASAYVSDRYAKSADALGNERLLSNLTTFLSGFGATAKVDDVPLVQVAGAFGLAMDDWAKLSSKLKYLGEQWDGLAAPRSGWAATISASPSGIVGRSVTMSVDQRLPATSLTVDQHIGDDVVAFYARQGTCTAQRCLLAFEFVSHAYIGFVKMMISFAEDEDINQGVNLHFDRLNQMPLRLTKIVTDSLLPSLGDGGQAIVLTRFDPTPNEADNIPVEFSLVSGVANHQELMDAGDQLRQWANSMVNQYIEIIRKMDTDQANMRSPVIASPTVTDDQDSNVFALAAMEFEPNAQPEGDDDNAAPAPAEPDLEDFDTVGTMFHWRLSDDVLAIGTNVLITKNMLTARQIIPPSRGLEPDDGDLRSVSWIDAVQIAKMFDQVDDNNARTFTQLIRCFDSFHAITTTNEASTIRRWKLAMPLGKN